MTSSPHRTTSPGHEFDKKFIARLVEAFGDERELPLIGCGSATWKKKARRAGLEADECYFWRRVKSVPDLAIDVVKTSGGIGKLRVYERLRIREVWFWMKGSFRVFRLGKGGYREVSRSALLPEFDLTRAATIVRTTKPADQPLAIRAFRASLRRL